MSPARPTVFTISAFWDAEAGAWSGTCDAVPFAAEAETPDGLLAAIEAMTADVLPDNHPEIDPASVYFQLGTLREVGPHPAAA